MTKNKKLIIILIIVLAIVLLIAGLVALRHKKGTPATGGNKVTNTPTQNLPAPEFLNDADKLELGIAPEQKIQAWRDANGKIVGYKVIKSDADIILDLAAIGPISPRQKPLVK